eukprot:783365_1
MEQGYEYTRKRKDFGRHPKFNDSDIQILANISSTEGKDIDWLDRHETHIVMDCTPKMSVHEVNTERFIQEHKSMQHSEGGWPKEVNTKEFQEKQRYLRRVENEPSFQTCVRTLASTCETAVMQSNAIDLYEEYFGDLAEDHSSEPPSGKMLTVFRDPNPVKRSAAKISWNPDGPAKLAVAYSVP